MKSWFVGGIAVFVLLTAPVWGQSSFNFPDGGAVVSDRLRLPQDAKVGSDAARGTPVRIKELIEALGVGSGLYGSCTPQMSAGDQAAVELVRIGPPAVEPLSQVVREISHPGADATADTNRRAFAVQILGRIGSRRALEALNFCLVKEPTGYVRVFAPPALERLHDPRSETALLVGLKDEFPDIQAGAAHALGTLRSTIAIHGLIALLGAPARMPAFSTGGMLGPRAVSPASNAAWALGQIGVPALQPLRNALASKDAQVRHDAALGLAWNLSPQGNADVRQLLRNADVELRIAAARSEATRRDSLAVPILAELLHDGSAQVRQTAAFALSEGGGLPGVRALIAAANGKDAASASPAAEGLRNIWNPHAADLLLEEVKQGKGRARLSAAEALLHYSDPRAVDPSLRLLTDPDPEMRVLAVWVVNQLRDVRTFPAMVRAASDPSESVRITATSLLGSRKSDPIVGPLLRKLADPSEQVRLYAIYGLGFKGDREAKASLGALLHDAAPRVQEAARKALEIIDGRRNAWN